VITNYKIVCLVQFNKIEFESSAILALSATVVLTSLVVPVELFRDKLSESDRCGVSAGIRVRTLLAPRSLHSRRRRSKSLQNLEGSLNFVHGVVLLETSSTRTMP